MEQWKVVFDEGFYVIPKSDSKPASRDLRGAGRVRREVRVVIRQMQNRSRRLDKSRGVEIAVKGYEIVIQNGENREKEVVLINREDILVGYGVMKLMELANMVNHQRQVADVWENNKHFLHHNGYCEFCSRWFTEYYGVCALKKKCPSCHRMTRCMNERKVTPREKVERYYLERGGARLFRGPWRR